MGEEMLDNIMPQWLRWAIAAIGMLATQNAFADSVAEFYRGKTLSLVVSTTAGTSYDLMGRTLARYLAKHIPGTPSIIVQNMPGADGIVAANDMYSVALKDGTVLAGLQGTVPFEPLLGAEEATFDANKFNWLGSPSAEICVLIVRAGVPVDNYKDLASREIAVGTSSTNSNPAFFARLLNQVLGTRLKLVFGYPGQNDVFLAMERGEVDGHSCVYYSSLVSTRPDWIKNKQVKLLLQYGPAKEQAIGDVPFAPDLVDNPEDKLLMQASFAPLALGRPYVMPPGVPAERVEAMREAMDAVLKDQDFLHEIEKLKLQIDGPLSGGQVQTLIKSTYAMSPSILDRLRKLMQP
jgi:tripartite-type tricarboxylate transporter receptor subunit TctC